MNSDSARSTVVYQVQATLALPPGRYQLRASATSDKLKARGSVYLDMDMPDFKRADVELGGVTIGYAEGWRVPTAGTPLPKDVLPVSPTLDRDFGRRETMRVVCDVTRKSGTMADATVELVDASDRVVKTIDRRQLSGAAPTHIDVALAMNDLAPGGYRVRV